MEWSKKKNQHWAFSSVFATSHLKIFRSNHSTWFTDDRVNKTKNTLKKATNYISSDSAEYAFLTQNI